MPCNEFSSNSEEDTSYASPPIAIEGISSQIEQPFDSENKKTKERTIAQAILEVMNEGNRPMTSQEIYTKYLKPDE